MTMVLFTSHVEPPDAVFTAASATFETSFLDLPLCPAARSFFRAAERHCAMSSGC